jgi:DNA-binding MarR family transcriptional regulator
VEPGRDQVGDLIAQWRVIRPELDLDAMATFGRLGRFSAFAGRSIEAVFAGHGLTAGDFDVLAALRRAGEPHVLKPSELARGLMLSPAGITSRLDRLERAGLLERRADRADRRSSPVALTEAGRERVDRAVADHVANETRLLAPLTVTERSALNEILRKLLAQFDDERNPSAR